MRLAARILLVGLLPYGQGCSGGRIATYPAQGAVHVDGAPAAGVNVYFHPLEDAGRAELHQLRPYAETDQDGKFQLTTFVRGDGAPAGRYRVTFTWWDRDPSEREAGSDPERRTRRTVRDKLQGRYADVENSPFEIQISSGANQLETFELSAPGEITK